MTTSNIPCRESRDPLEAMSGSEESIRDILDHAGRCKACRMTLLGERCYPPGCSAPYLGYRSMHYAVELSLGEKEYPPGSPGGLIAHRELVQEHRAPLEVLIPLELVAHVIDCVACMLDLVSAREGLSEYAKLRLQRDTPPPH